MSSPRWAQRMAVIGVLVAAAAAPSSAWATDDGAAVAIPSVYRVQVTVDVPALARSVPGADQVVEQLPPGLRTQVYTGTAFAVSSEGILATASSIAAPTPQQLAARILPAMLQRRGLATNSDGARSWTKGATARGSRVVRIVLWPAYATGQSPWQADAIPATVVPRGTRRTVTLLSAPALVGVPRLPLNQGVDDPGQVTLMGFGSSLNGAQLEPWLRTGTRKAWLAHTGGEELAYSPTAFPGDAGAPLVDHEGHVSAMAVATIDDDSCSRCTRAVDASLIARAAVGADIALTPGDANRHLAEALAAADRGDGSGAGQALDRAEAAFPGTKVRADLAGVVERRAHMATHRSPLRFALITVGLLQLIAAGFMLWRAFYKDDLRPPRGRHRTRSSSTARSR